jgi:hypothetical protein
MANRPDLQAQRLTVSFAEANIRAVLASRFDDLLLLVQPYTFHDGREGTGAANSLSWTVGVTVPLPIYNRQQGNLLKARQAAEQARTRLASLEWSVAAEVEAAVLEHNTSHEALDRTWTDFEKFKSPANQIKDPTTSDFLWPDVNLVPYDTWIKVGNRAVNRIDLGPDMKGVFHFRFIDIGGSVKEAAQTDYVGNADFRLLVGLYRLITESDNRQPDDKDKLKPEDRRVQISGVISRVIRIVGTPEQKLKDLLRLKLVDSENRIADLRSDQVSDKLKTYWETLIRHRKSMLKLNTVTGVCVSP